LGLVERRSKGQRQTEAAHLDLALLEGCSLLQGVGPRDEVRNRATAYAFQPVTAEVTRIRAAGAVETLAAARAGYARWVDLGVTRGYGKGGIDYNPAVADATRAVLLDIPAAVPHLPMSVGAGPPGAQPSSYTVRPSQGEIDP
jgi:hypothetical protein